MRRLTSYLLISILALAAGTGCKNKKKDPAGDAYNAGLDFGTDTYAAQPAYKPLPVTEPAASDPYLTGMTDTGGARYHTVQKKETLYAIARMYYNGDQSRWKDIYEANRAEVHNPNMIRVGQRLIIP